MTNLKFFYLFWSLLNIFIISKGTSFGERVHRSSIRDFHRKCKNEGLFFDWTLFFSILSWSKLKLHLKWGIFILHSGEHINGRSCNLPLVQTCQQNAICFAYSILDFNINTAWWPWIQVLLYLSLGKFIISVLYWYLSTSYNNVSVADPTVH